MILNFTNHLAIFLSLIFCMHCGVGVPYNSNAILKRPIHISIKGISGKKIELTYQIQNQEEDFDGYNIYLSRTGITEAEAEINIPPLKIDGSIPSVKHNPKEYNPANSQVLQILYYNDNITQLEVNVTYFVRIAAHSRTGIRSELSNESSTVILP